MIYEPQMIPTTQDTFNELYKEFKDILSDDQLFQFLLDNMKSYVNTDRSTIDEILDEHEYDIAILKEIINDSLINENNETRFSQEGEYEYIIDKFCEEYKRTDDGSLLLETIINKLYSYDKQKVMIGKIIEKKAVSNDDIIGFRDSNENNILHYCVKHGRSPFDFFNTNTSR